MTKQKSYLINQSFDWLGANVNAASDWVNTSPSDRTAYCTFVAKRSSD